MTEWTDEALAAERERLARDRARRQTATLRPGIERASVVNVGGHRILIVDDPDLNVWIDVERVVQAMKQAAEIITTVGQTMCHVFGQLAPTFEWVLELAAVIEDARTRRGKRAIVLQRRRRHR